MSVESHVIFRMGTKRQCDEALDYLRKTLGLFSAFPNYSNTKVEAINCFSLDNFRTHITECSKLVASKHPAFAFSGSGWITCNVDGAAENIAVEYSNGMLTISTSAGDIYLDPSHPACPECERNIGEFLQFGRFTCPTCHTTFESVDDSSDENDEIADFMYSTTKVVQQYSILEVQNG